MTTLGLDYLRNLEQKRTNLAQEAETNRANLAKEAENLRHNTASEEATLADIAEKAQHNRNTEAQEKANLKQKQAELAHTKANEAAKRSEEKRANAEREFNDKLSALGKADSSTYDVLSRDLTKTYGDRLYATSDEDVLGKAWYKDNAKYLNSMSSSERDKYVSDQAELKRRRSQEAFNEVIKEGRGTKNTQWVAENLKPFLEIGANMSKIISGAMSGGKFSLKK